jgi:hypothetical protein
MPKLITLSTGETVTFRPHFTHDAETIYSNAREKGVVDKEYVETDADGNRQPKIVRERPVTNYADAIRETLLYMIDTVTLGEATSKPTRAWIGGLPEPDYGELAEALVAVRRETQEAIAKKK